MYTLDLARAHQQNLQREASRDSAGVGTGRTAGRLRRLMGRARHAV